MIQSCGMFLALAGLSAGTVLAAAPAAEAGDFSGTRLGVHADYMWGKVTPSGFSGAGDQPLTGYDTKGSGADLTITHDWQSDTTVFGLYASVGSVDAKGSTSQALTVPQMEGTTVEHHGFDTDLSRLASAGGRVGAVINDNVLIYAQAGVASGRLKIVETGDNANAARKVDKTGYTVGAGVDLQLDDRWTLGVIWTHYDLGKTSFSPGAYGSGKIAVKGDVAGLGLSYRF